MNRSEFMFALAQLLADLPFEERSEALKFYNNYFDDAGPENEQHIIEELKSPEAVAASIRAGVDGTAGNGEFCDDGYHENYENAHTEQMVYNDGNAGYQSSTENEQNAGYQNNAGYGKNTGYQNSAGDQQNGQWQYNYDNNNNAYPQRRPHKKLNGKTIAIIVLCICAAPVLLGIGGGIFGAVVGLIGGIIGIIAGVIGGAVGGIFGGIFGFIKGIFLCFSSPSQGIALCGTSLVKLGLGLILMMLLVWFATAILPKFLRWIKKMIGNLSKRRKGV